MAWKLKKWKGADAEEEKALPQGFHAVDEHPEDNFLVIDPPQSSSSVIPLAPPVITPAPEISLDYVAPEPIHAPLISEAYDVEQDELVVKDELAGQAAPAHGLEAPPIETPTDFTQTPHFLADDEIDDDLLQPIDSLHVADPDFTPPDHVFTPVPHEAFTSVIDMDELPAAAEPKTAQALQDEEPAPVAFAAQAPVETPIAQTTPEPVDSIPFEEPAEEEIDPYTAIANHAMADAAMAFAPLSGETEPEYFTPEEPEPTMIAAEPIAHEAAEPTMIMAEPEVHEAVEPTMIVAEPMAHEVAEPEVAAPEPAVLEAALPVEDISEPAVAEEEYPDPILSQAVAPAPEPTIEAEQAEESLGAFAPYKPTEAPPPEPERFMAVNEEESQMYTPPGGGAEQNGSGMHAQSIGAPQFEDALTFAPVASSKLIVKIGPFSASYDVNKPELTIGRPDLKTGTSPDIGLEWDDAVSRHHARILHKSDGDYIEDVGSSNGTLLNGQPIAVDTPILLKDGDTITIGDRTQISYLQ